MYDDPLVTSERIEFITSLSFQLCIRHPKRTHPPYKSIRFIFFLVLHIQYWEAIEIDISELKDMEWRMQRI
jgi:hypothetical protein